MLSRAWGAGMAEAAMELSARPAAGAVGERAGDGVRITSIDILRGIVIVLMALDHVRDFFHVSAFVFDPLDVEKSSLGLYLTRWITHFCAPTFAFLAGVSAFLHGARVRSRPQLSRFLLTRGLWLIVVEFTLVNFAWNFDLPGLALLVIWALGASMVVLAALVWLPPRAVLAVGALIVLGHNLLNPLTPQAMGALAPLWTVLHEGGPVIVNGQFVAITIYPLLPWIGVMALGYGLGFIFQLEQAPRRRAMTLLGAAMIAGFFVWRAFEVYGDANPWQAHPAPWQTLGDVFDTTKYPPSLLFVLMTLGPVLMLMPWIERFKGPVTEVFLTFGRAPFFVYVAHILLAHALMLAVGLALGYPAGVFVSFMPDPRPLIEARWGFSLPVVYGVWLLVLALLYPLCRWFGALKRRRRDWWLSYL